MRQSARYAHGSYTSKIRSITFKLVISIFIRIFLVFVGKLANPTSHGYLLMVI